MDKEMEKLGNYCKIISGYAFKSTDLANGTEIPVIKIGNISNGNDVIIDSSTQYVSKEFLSIDKKYHVKKGDVLISLTGSHINQPNSMVGRSCRNFSDTEYLLNQRAGKVLPNKNADKNYLYYLLNTESFKYSICNRAYGAANQANVSPSDIENIKWDFPSLPIQQKIASILSTYDNLIQNYKKQIEDLQTCASELYKEWFVRFRFPGYKTTQFENGIPVGWKVERIGEYCSIKVGGDVPEENSETKDEKHKYPIFSNGINEDGLYGFTDTFKISEPSVSISARGTVGFVCLRREPYYPIVRLICLIPKKEIGVFYLYHSLKYADLDGNGTSQQQLTAPMVSKRKIVIAEEKLIEKFNSNAKVIYDEIDVLRTKISNLTQQRDLLLPRLMSGKLEVE